MRACRRGPAATSPANSWPVAGAYTTPSTGARLTNQGDVDGEVAASLHELLGAIQRIDQEELFGRRRYLAGGALFFSHHGHARGMPGQVPQDDLFGFMVGGRDRGVILLGMHRKRAVINTVRGAACLKGGRDHGFQ